MPIGIALFFVVWTHTRSFSDVKEAHNDFQNAWGTRGNYGRGE
jgi:hypothetical protein